MLTGSFPEYAEMERTERLASYLGETTGFVCPWGRDALHAGRVRFAFYLEAADPETRVQSLVPDLLDLAANIVSAIVWTRSNSPTHAEASDRAWLFYTDLQCACRSVELGRALSPLERGAIERAVRHFTTMRDWREYISIGSPTIASQPLHLISLNYLYHPGHPLYAPVFAHSVTRQADLLRIRLRAYDSPSKRRRWRTFLAAMRLEETTYVQGLPYYLPDDPTMTISRTEQSSKMKRRRHTAVVTRLDPEARESRAALPLECPFSRSKHDDE